MNLPYIINKILKSHLLKFYGANICRGFCDVSDETVAGTYGFKWSTH